MSCGLQPAGPGLTSLKSSSYLVHASLGSLSLPVRSPELRMVKEVVAFAVRDFDCANMHAKHVGDEGIGGRV